MKENIYVIGDIHGRYKALKEVLNKSKFDRKNDTLIVMGDIVDGGYNTSKVIDELLKIKSLVFIKGNHDNWMINYIFKGHKSNEWINQGGANTLNSYGGKVVPGSSINTLPVMVDVNGVKVPRKHIEFLGRGLYYFEFDNMLFVHGGFDPNKPIETQDPHFLMWDRTLIKYAENNNIEKYDKVFIGHTSTQMIEREWINYICRDCEQEWEKKVKSYRDMRGEPVCPKCNSKDIFQSLGCTKPLKIGNLFCLDTGGGWNGKLTIMNIKTEEYWQSKLQEEPIK